MEGSVMALYRYTDSKGHQADVRHSMKAADRVEVVCGECGAIMWRQFSAPAIHWGGFPAPSHDEQTPGFRKWIAGAEQRREQYQMEKPAHEARQVAAEVMNDGD